MENPEFFDESEKKAAEKLLGVINASGTNNIAELDVAGFCRAYESLCNAAAVRHGAIHTFNHLAPLRGGAEHSQGPQ